MSGVTGVNGMYGLYGVGIPVRGPPDTLTGLSRIVVFVYGALWGGLNCERNGRVELLLLMLRGGGTLMVRIVVLLLLGVPAIGCRLNEEVPLGLWMLLLLLLRL